MTVLNAHFDGKQIVLDEPMPAEVPPNAKVRVIVEETGPTKPRCLQEIADMAVDADVPPDYSTEHARIPQLREGLLAFSGIVKGGPSDMARNHDHYLHGTPRK